VGAEAGQYFRWRFWRRMLDASSSVLVVGRATGTSLRLTSRSQATHAQAATPVATWVRVLADGPHGSFPRRCDVDNAFCWSAACGRHALRALAEALYYGAPATSCSCNGGQSEELHWSTSCRAARIERDRACRARHAGRSKRHDPMAGPRIRAPGARRCAARGLRLCSPGMVRAACRDCAQRAVPDGDYTSRCSISDCEDSDIAVYAARLIATFGTLGPRGAKASGKPLGSPHG